jgi:putative nucleotidyltransferase with HDIG domain
MLKINSQIPATKGAYVVGGSVRDLFLGVTPADYDIAVLQFPEKYAMDLAACVKGHIVEIGKNKQVIYRVITEKNSFDVSGIEGNGIEDDLARRDFTINAVGYNLSSGEITDLFGGLNDILVKKIRMVSKDVFVKDPVRLIRAYRMATTLDFEIEEATMQAITDNAPLITKAAGERIKTELFKILSHPKSYGHIKQMQETGLLSGIFPELKALQGCIQNRYHEYDVMDHSFEAFSRLETLLNDKRAHTETIDFPVSAMNEKRSALLKYSILLHDIGKPSTRTFDDDGNVHFFGHETKSAEMAKEISKRLKLSNNESDYIDFIIRNHILPLNLFNSCRGNTPSKKAIARFFIKLKDMTPDILLHTIADITGKGVKDERNESFIGFAFYLQNQYYSDYALKITGPRLITGKDLIKEFGLSPSRLFKKILSDVEESRISNELKSREEALALAKELIKNYSGE